MTLLKSRVSVTIYMDWFIALPKGIWTDLKPAIRPIVHKLFLNMKNLEMYRFLLRLKILNDSHFTLKIHRKKYLQTYELSCYKQVQIIFEKKSTQLVGAR